MIVAGTTGSALTIVPFKESRSQYGPEYAGKAKTCEDKSQSNK